MVWDLYGDAPIVRLERESSLLGAFIGLAGASDEGILKFAKCWAPLGLCDHDLVLGHDDVRTWPGWTQAPDETCNWRWKETRRIWEPTSAWRLWATRARATLNVAAQLYKGAIAPEHEWRMASGVGHRHSGRRKLTMPETISEGWDFLERYMQAWIYLGGIAPMFRANDGKPQILLGTSLGLFGPISLRLLLAISRVDGLAICAGCGEGYVPHKQPQGMRRNFCEDCRDRGVPGVYAARDYRLRKHTAGRLAKEGRSAHQIAKITGWKVRTVQDWIQPKKQKTRSNNRSHKPRSKT